MKARMLNVQPKIVIELSADEADVLSRGSGPHSVQGECTPDNPYGQSTVKAVSGKFYDGFDMQRKFRALIAKVLKEV